MEVAHFETCRAVAFVDADCLFCAVGVGREFEFDLVLDVAAVAGARVGFEIGHEAGFFVVMCNWCC